MDQDQPRVENPSIRFSLARIVLTIFGVLLAFGIFWIVTGCSIALVKIVGAALAVYGTFAQAYLAAEHGAARRRSESRREYKKRLFWRDRGELASWVALGVSVIAIAAAELRDTI